MEVLLILGLVVIVGGLKIAAFFAFPIWLRWTGRMAPRKANRAHRDLIEPHIETVYPEGDGPFPAVLLFHGCGGVRQISHNYANLAARNGIAALIVDSLTPRGIDYETALETVCKGKTLWGRERASDVYAALEIARDDPKVDAQRLGLAGWSHGGWAILDGLALHAMGTAPDGLIEVPDAPFDGVKAILLMYPFGSRPSLARTHSLNADADISAILVKSDTHAKETHVEAILKREQAAGHKVSWELFSDVTHGFEEPDHHPESILRYDAEATARAEQIFTQTFGHKL